MRKTRRTSIAFETERLLVISRRQLVEKWCGICGAEARMIEIKEASTIIGESQREIFRRIENGSLHFAEISSGNLLICLDSLLKDIRE